MTETTLPEGGCITPAEPAASEPLAVCRHCRVGNPSRARRLCFQCYMAPAIRHQYAPVSAYGRRGIGNPRGAGRLPEEPTKALPGTPEKLAVFEQRAAANQQLHHPFDATGVAEEPTRTNREGLCRAA